MLAAAAAPRPPASATSALAGFSASGFVPSAAAAAAAERRELGWPRSGGLGLSASERQSLVSTDVARGRCLGGVSDFGRGAAERAAREAPAPAPKRPPPFAWQPAPAHSPDFEVSGEAREVVTKVYDFREPGILVPAAGTLQMFRGGLYRWTLLLEHLPSHRPEIHLGVHGTGHRKPWRLLSSSRCSRARDDELWRSRPEGDLALQDGDYVHVQVDLRGLHLPFGMVSMAINAGPMEEICDDLPLAKDARPLVPVVLMGGHRSCVRICPAY